MIFQNDNYFNVNYDDIDKEVLNIRSTSKQDIISIIIYIQVILVIIIMKFSFVRLMVWI